MSELPNSWPHFQYSMRKSMSASRKPRKAHKVGTRIPRPISAPMLIKRGMQNTDLETRERMYVEAFSGGWATKDHFDNLADMRDCLLLAAAVKKDAGTIGMCRAAGIALMNIRDRYTKTLLMEATTEELSVLREFATTYSDYWLRQTEASYEMACAALDRARCENSLEVALPSAPRRAK